MSRRRIKRGRRPMAMMQLAEQAHHEGFMKGELNERRRHQEDVDKIAALETEVRKLKGAVKMMDNVIRRFDSGNPPNSFTVQTALFYGTVYTKGEYSEEAAQIAGEMADTAMTQIQ